MTDFYGPTPLTSAAVTDDGEPTPDQWFAYLQERFRAIQRPRYCDGRDRPGQSMGYAGGFAQTAHDTHKEQGKIQWGQAFKDGFKAMLPAILGGAIGAGAFAKGHQFYRSKRGTG